MAIVPLPLEKICLPTQKNRLRTTWYVYFFIFFPLILNHKHIIQKPLRGPFTLYVIKAIERKSSGVYPLEKFLIPLTSIRIGFSKNESS